MNHEYDTIVIGVGGMGSAAAYHMADRGLDVLGLERYDIPHTMGSSHGDTRIIRLVQHEHPSYVPLVLRAYDLWQRLQDEQGEQLLYVTGSLHAAERGSEPLSRWLESCRSHDIDHEVLSAEEVTDRFPGYRLPDDCRAVFQPDGGFVLPERTIVSHVRGAQQRGAEIRARERVLGWDSIGDGVEVRTDEATYRADNLTVTAGAWASEFLPELSDQLEPQRRVMGWFQPRRPELFAPDRFPVFTVKTKRDNVYGFPIADNPGFKIGNTPTEPERIDPDEMSRRPTSEEEATLRASVERLFPEGAGPTMRLASCIVTESEDEHFVLDTHPDHPQVSIAAGFTGHGGKFFPVVGEILADLVTAGDTEHDIDLFRYRF